MGKKKNKNKVSGAVKTAAKTEKKLANKLKKELATLGEEDIAKVIAEIEREEAKRAAASEKTLKKPPTSRAYASLTPHPTNNELIMFGGEFHNGQKTEVYNELLFFNPVNNTWRQIKAPAGPPPRSAHQAVATPANKGELWVFGGEFISPSETQFYHYKDLWCFSLAEKKWEKFHAVARIASSVTTRFSLLTWVQCEAKKNSFHFVIAPNAPSSRSGHRMTLLGRKLFIFGGYSDDGRDCKYFDDLHTFCLDTRQWSKLVISGRGPCARSACVMLPCGNDSLIIYGGFSRIREGRTEKTQTHTDMFKLSFKTGWTWRALSGGSTARAGIAAAVNAHSNRGYVFGGVCDVEETEEELKGEMSDELQVLDLDTNRFHPVVLRTNIVPTVPIQTGQEKEKEEEEKETVTVVTDEVFTMKLGSSQASEVLESSVTIQPKVERSGPTPRMSAMMTVQRSVLYLYGGVLEKDEKQFYLGDMYSLDLHKLNEWKTIIEQPPLPDWLGSDSEYSGTESETDDSDDSDEEEE